MQFWSTQNLCSGAVMFGAVGAAAAMQVPLQTFAALMLGALLFGVYFLYVAVQELQSMAWSCHSMQAAADKVVEKAAYMESRLERLIQDGMETGRHVGQIIMEYDMERAEGMCRWPLRRTLEEQMAWSAARQRMGELHSLAAWSLVVEAAVRMVRAQAQDMQWEAQHTESVKARGLQTEASRLLQNLAHLQRHVVLLRGAPSVQNLQSEMQNLVLQHLQMKVEHGEAAAALQLHAQNMEMFTTGVAFLSRELPEPVQGPANM